MSDLLKVMVGGSSYLCKWDPYFVVIGGIRYKIVKIGNQIWLTENFKLKIGSNYYWYNNNQEYYEPLGCGLLYPYSSIELINNYLNSNNPGWRVATHADFSGLFGMVQHAYELKKKDINYWQGSLPGTDVLGFSAIPSGSFNIHSGFQNFGIFCGWFTKDLYSNGRAYVPTLNETDNLYPDNNSDKNSNYLPIRLVKDVT